MTCALPVLASGGEVPAGFGFGLVSDAAAEAGMSGIPRQTKRERERKREREGERQRKREQKKIDGQINNFSGG